MEYTTMTNDNILKQIADYNLLYGLFDESLGLYKGKMGMALFFFFLSRHYANHWYEEFAVELLDDICNGFLHQSSITFADGLCGIGWSIEFLKKQGFVDGNTDEVLEEIDREVMERNVCRMENYSLETGLKGIAAYVQSRLQSERTSASSHPFDKKYLEDLEAACQKAGVIWPGKEYEISAVWEKIMDVFSLSKKIGWQQGLVILNKVR